MKQVHRRTKWDEELLTALRKGYESGLRDDALGAACGVSSSAAMIAVYRYLKRREFPSDTGSSHVRSEDGTRQPWGSGWTEARLTETWIDRKARRARERALLQLSNAQAGTSEVSAAPRDRRLKDVKPT